MEDNGVIQSTFHTLSKPNIHEMIMTNTSEWQTQNAKCSRIPHDLNLNTLIRIIDLGAHAIKDFEQNGFSSSLGEKAII